MVVVLLALAVLIAPTPAAAAPSGTPQTVASGLSIPWDVLQLPDGRILITERSERRIRVLSADGALRAAPVWSELSANKVLGIDTHPDYAVNRWVYVYVTYSTGSRVLRLIDDGTNLRLDRVIFDRPIGTDGNHDGGRIRFGPDGKLYVTTGDIHDPSLPRDRSKLNGKILRLEDDGSAPADNPFAGEGGDARYVWSSGHRHPQGIAWDGTGRMWSSEHGPSGESYAPAGENTGNDEINLIVRGGDYGWPQSSGARVVPGTRAPVWVADSTAVAPGGMAFAPGGRLYVPMLAGRQLRVFTPQGDGLVDEGPLYQGTRLRAASVVGCALAFTTDKQAGATDELRGVGISPCSAPAPTTPSPPPAPTPGVPGGPSSGPTLPPSAPVPTSPGSPTGTAPGATGAPAALTDAAARLVARTSRLLKRLGSRRIAGRERLTAMRVRGFPTGTLRVEVLHRPRRGKTVMVANALVRVRRGTPVTVRLATTRRGRPSLRRNPRARLRVVVAHRPASGPFAVRTKTFVVTPAGTLSLTR